MRALIEDIVGELAEASGTTFLDLVSMLSDEASKFLVMVNAYEGDLAGLKLIGKSNPYAKALASGGSFGSQARYVSASLRGMGFGEKPFKSTKPWARSSMFSQLVGKNGVPLTLKAGDERNLNSHKAKEEVEDMIRDQADVVGKLVNRVKISTVPVDAGLKKIR